MDPQVENISPQTNAKKGNKTLIVIIIIFVGVLVLCCCAVGFIAIARNQGELNKRPNDTNTSKQLNTDESNDDLYYERDGSLPISSEFSSEVMTDIGMLGYKNGFTKELIAIGGQPVVYNFAIDMPNGWSRDTLEFDQYRYLSPDGRSAGGVLYASSETSQFKSYTNCAQQVKDIYKNLDTELEILSKTNVNVDGEDFERVKYEYSDEKNVKIIGIDQCYKNDDSLLTVYAIFAVNIDKDILKNQETILDEFRFIRLGN